MFPGNPNATAIERTYPWFSGHDDLAADGYIEEEFFLSGHADAYDHAGTHLGSAIPYRSRMLVRRPAGAARFSGTVIVEWLNVSEGYDVDVLWNRRAAVRAGHAWVGVSAQHAGVDRLREWSTARYGELDVTAGGGFTEDELACDVFAQAGRVIRGGVPLGPLRAETLLAAGASQSAGWLASYYDHVRPYRAGVFDGYACVIGPVPARAGAEPVFQVLSETDVPYWWTSSPERPADTDRFRRWEVAGTSHTDWHLMEYIAPLCVRDAGSVPELEHGRPPLSRVPLHHVVAAALDHLAVWARDGIAPPTAEPLLLDGERKVRDEHGIVRGGIRLSQVEVPTALNTGHNDGPGAGFLCGTHIPFSEDELAGLYPSRLGYLLDVARADWRNVRAGFLHRDDARRNLAEAAARR